MAPIIHCVRHAQGFHNLGYYDIPDPKLTPLGEQQCSTLKTTFFSDQSNISLVSASPLRRTIHTAFLTFEPALKNGKCSNEIWALPDAQETSDFACDTGSDVEVLQSFCADEHWPVDLQLVRPGWNVKTLGTRYSPAGTAIRARARDARKQIRQKARELIAKGDTNPEIVLVTHGGYLHYFTEDWEDSDKMIGTGWANTETRSYTFELGVEGDDENAHLTETTDSRRRRGKEHAMFSKDQQEPLFHQSMTGWENQGLQNPSKIGMNSDLDTAQVNREERCDTVKVIA